ncbi:MAG: PilZ domain-containing protein [Novosphingobium sp.]
MSASPVLAPTDRRYGDRVNVSRRAVLRFDGKAEEVDVEDLASDGCRIRAATELEPFAAVSIGLAGIGHTPARLIWRSGDLYGCAFEQRLPLGAAMPGITDNVARLPESTEPRAGASEDEPKYSLRARVAIIAGLSLALWAPILGAVALLF